MNYQILKTKDKRHVVDNLPRYITQIDCSWIKTVHESRVNGVQALVGVTVSEFRSKVNYNLGLCCISYALLCCHFNAFLYFLVVNLVI